MTRPSLRGSRRTAAIGAALMTLTLTSPAMAQSPATSPTASIAPTSSTAPAVLALFPDAGFRIALPADWLAIELAPDPDAAIAAFTAAHPELAGHVAAFRTQGPMDTFAVAPLSADDPFPATFASFQGMNMGFSADQMRELTENGLAQLGVDGEIESEAMELSGSSGFHIGYAWNLPRPDGTTRPVHVDQYTLVTPEAVLVFSFTDDSPVPDHGRAMAASFELLP